MRLPFFRKASGGVERAIPELSQPIATIDPMESVIGYLAEDTKTYPHRDDLLREINVLGMTKDLSPSEREALVGRIVAKREEKAQNGQ